MNFTCTRSILLVGLVLGGCGGGSNGGSNSKSDMAVAMGDMAGAGGNYYTPPGYSLVPFVGAGGEHMFAKADMVLTQGKDYLAVIETDAGRMVLDLYEDKTPVTVNSFVFLAIHHYFDGIAFHRVIEKFMAQTGDPNTLDEDRAQWGRGNPGYYFPLEIDKSVRYDREGVVGMANSGPSTNGSQFFITFVPYPSLNDKYTIFAQLTEGQSVLSQVVRGEPPEVPTRMTRVYIVAK